MIEVLFYECYRSYIKTPWTSIRAFSKRSICLSTAYITMAPIAYRYRLLETVMTSVLHRIARKTTFQVFFEQLNYELLREAESYSMVNLLSDFGGQFGLWLGCSIITLFEFAWIIGQLLWISFDHHYEEYQLTQIRKSQGYVR